MIQPKPCGSFLDLDDQGHVIKKVSYDLIQPRWKPVINDVISAYKEFFGSNLHSIWLRGSVAKGEAVDGLADFDSFGYVYEPTDSFDQFEQEIEALEPHYPFCAGIECEADPIAVLENDRIMRRIIKTQAICLFGEDISASIPPHSLRDMIFYSKYLRHCLEKVMPQFLKEDNGDPKQIRGTCNWTAKRLLRSLYETIMLEENRWTNDLWPCYERFSYWHPERESDAMELLQLCLNPVADEQRIRAAVGVFTPWIYDEIVERLGIESDGTC